MGDPGRRAADKNKREIALLPWGFYDQPFIIRDLLYK